MLTVISYLLSVISKTAIKTIVVAAVFLLITLYPSLFTSSCHAAEAGTTIVSDTLEYFSNMRKYVARGSVRIEQKDAGITADEVVYSDETGEAAASGNVTYRDPRVSIGATKADINIERRTGRIYDADIYISQDNYHIRAKDIQKKGDNEYEGHGEMAFTTCEDLPAAWCFRGKDIDLIVGDRLKAKDATFSVRDLPVLYTPYLWVPVNAERKTGFLVPVVSNSSDRGFGLQVPFFWVIAENRDATLVLDAYSKRGLGTGLEYRFIAPGDVKSAWWAYHINDKKLDTDFIEVRGLHEDRRPEGRGWFLNVNFVNEKDFYREFNPHKEKQVQRFLESTGELNIPFEQSRLYLLSQYWVDLKYNTGDIPQRLPEAGYVMRYTRLGAFMISADAAVSNFWRENGISAGRLDIYPRILHTAGNDIVFTQIAAARGTAYSYYRGDYRDNGTMRSSFEYDGSIHTRLFRQYGTVTHVVEPTVRYHYISSSENNVPVFDSAELFKNRSRIELGFLNRVLVKGREIAVFSVKQPVDIDHGDRPFSPMEFELGMKNPLPVRLEAAYNVNTGRLDTLSSEVSIPFSKGLFNVGQRYNRAEQITVYKAGIEIRPVKPIQMLFSVWYDAKGEGLTNMTASMKYESQCWGIRIEASKKSGDFTLQVLFDLFGVTAKHSRV